MVVELECVGWFVCGGLRMKDGEPTHVEAPFFSCFFFSGCNLAALFGVVIGEVA